jgi:two-component system, NarL family, invasion response regulator UvrY
VIKLILIDDHTLVRQGIRLLLSGNKEIEIVGETAIGAEVMHLVRELLPDVIVLDMNLPDISGLEVTTRLMQINPKSKILIISSATHPEFSQRTLEAGVLGYISKNTHHAELIKAIKTVNKGQLFISTDIADKLVLAKIDNKTSHIFAQLTQKEMEILLLYLRSISTADIAKRLNISDKTVQNHRSHIFHKLGVSNDVGLMLLAVREGLVMLDEGVGCLKKSTISCP